MRRFRWKGCAAAAEGDAPLVDGDRRSLLIAMAGAPIAAAAGRADAFATVPPANIVDVHAHVAITDYLRLLAAGGVPLRSLSGAALPPVASGAGADDEAAVAGRVRMMDVAGVRTQILSPALAPYLADEASAVRAARIVNDRHATLSRAHPGRIAAFVSLPLPHIAPALQEIRRGLDELGMAGVAMHASCLGVSIADDRFQPLFTEMDRRRTTLFLHPCANGLCSHLLNDWHLDACAGPLLEDSIVAMHLIAKNVPSRYPDLRIIVPHLGGGLATMLDRLDNQMPVAIPGLAARPSEMARSFWYDTASHGSRTALRSAIEGFGDERLLPGSDFPFLLSYEQYGRAFDYIREAVPADIAARILDRNARSLFPPA